MSTPEHNQPQDIRAARQAISEFSKSYATHLQQCFHDAWLVSTDFADLGQIGVPRRTHSRMLATIASAIASIGLKPLCEVSVTNATEKTLLRDPFFVADARGFAAKEKPGIRATFDCVGLEPTANGEVVRLVVEYESIDSDFDLTGPLVNLMKIEPIIRRFAALEPAPGRPQFGRVLVVTLTTGRYAGTKTRKPGRKGDRTLQQNEAIATRARELIESYEAVQAFGLICLWDEGIPGSEIRLELEMAGSPRQTFAVGTPAPPPPAKV